jgi:DNA repair photolyase
MQRKADVMQELHWIDNKTILTPTGGFLATGYTHTLNPYVGCSFAGALLKIYMSSSTDPYIPQEDRLERTRALLQEMVQRPPDVLVLQTRSPLIYRDLDLILQIAAQCELWVSLTVETDMDPVPGLPRHASPPARRLETLQAFRAAGIQTQATLSPLLPLSNPAAFAQQLDEACVRIIVDHYLLGDGSKGWRTQHTDFPQRLTQAGYAEWNTLEKFWQVRDFLAQVLGAERVLVSCEGFNAVGSARSG